MKQSRISELAPPTPACFHDRLSWSSYLFDCQQGKRPSSRPFDGGIFKPDFNFCGDCTQEHSRLMSRAGKCKPDQFKVIPIKVAEPA